MGMLVKRNEEIKGAWERHFASVINEVKEGRAEVTIIEVKLNAEPPYPEGEVVRGKIEEVIKMTQVRKEIRH